MESVSLWRRVVAEALGTGLLLAAIVGSGIMAQRLAGGNAALALLCNAAATGALLTVLITMFAPLSGAHLNPAVTLVMILRRKMAAPDGLAYVTAQISGALLGTWLAHAMFAEPILQVSATVREGSALWLAEGIATFGLILTIFGTLRSQPQAVAAMVGLYIFAAYWFTASTSFANPAVTIARALTDTFSGIAPSGVLGFIAAQLCGAIVAALVAPWLFGPRGDPRQEMTERV